MPKPITPSESRTLKQLQEHYEIEKELASRLRAASPGERRKLYGTVYDELFRRVPSHPQVTGKASGSVSSLVVAQAEIVVRFLSETSVFLDIGAGDCALSVAIAKRVSHVYAVDVSEEITVGLTLPENVEVRLSNGTDIPVPSGTIDVAWSNQLMEHLHPEDALEQLRNVYDALAPGGVYICLTPNRLTGPHDISAYFDDEASGFHLKEYTTRELVKLFRGVGFANISVLVGGRGHFLSVPPPPVALLEQLLGLLPRAARHEAVRRFRANSVLGIRVVARK